MWCYRSEIGHAIATLALAFGTDPLAHWTYGDPHHYLMHIPELFRALGISSFKAGTAERTVDGLGVALWLPPRIHGDDEPLEAVIAESMVRHYDCCDALSLKFYEGISMSKLTPNQQTIGYVAATHLR
jgi:hypothetical protein